MSRRDTEVITFNIDAVNLIGNNRVMRRFDTEYELLRADFRWTVGSTNGGSGTVALYKAASGTAIGSGTALLSAAVAVDAGGANSVNTTVTPKLSTVAGATVIARDSYLGLVGAGTLTSLFGLCITLIMRQRKTPDGGLR